MKHDNKKTEIKNKDTHGQEDKFGKKDTNKLGGNLDKRKSKSGGGAVG